MSDTPAAARTLAVLSALAHSAEPLPAGHLQATLGIPKASLYRLLTVLAEQGFVTHVPDTGRWALGVAAYELAWGYQRQAPLQRVGRPLLRRLVDATGHSGHLTILQGNDVVYVVEERAPNRPGLVTDVGVRLPAELTASGIAMLSVLPDAQLTALYPSSRTVAQRDGRGPTSLRQLRTMVRAARRQGYASEESVVTPGFSSLALPVPDRSGHPLAAVALTFDPAGVDDAERARLLEAMGRIVAALQARLGVPAGVSPR